MTETRTQLASLPNLITARDIAGQIFQAAGIEASKPFYADGDREEVELRVLETLHYLDTFLRQPGQAMLRLEHGTVLTTTTTTGEGIVALVTEKTEHMESPRVLVTCGTRDSAVRHLKPRKGTLEPKPPTDPLTLGLYSCYGVLATPEDVQAALDQRILDGGNDVMVIGDEAVAAFEAALEERVTAEATA